MKYISKPILLIIVFFSLAFTAFAQEDASNFIEENPDSVSVICMEGDETVVSHLADEELTLASSAKTIILAEYARQVALGNLDPEEEVTLSDVEQYYIAGTDGNAYPQWLTTLEADAETATLSQIVDGMIIFSTNAGADYLLSRLDSDGFSELYEILELENTDLPSFFLGHLLFLSNHETGITDLDYVDTLDEETFFSEQARLVDLFINDEAWRADELAFRDTPQGGLPDLATQTAYFDRFSTQSTANDMLTVIQSAFVDSGLSEDAQDIMRGHLDWLFDVNPANAEVYEALATKGGAYAGVLTSVWYADAIGFEPTTLVVLYHDLPVDTWQDWLTTGAHQSLEIQTITTVEECDVFADILPDNQSD
ncbi:MAG: serine hydrolase [Phototrophicaceae bacterium]